jgi:hypothetical protein
VNIAALERKMKTLRTLDKNFKLFGTQSHAYKLNPVLSEKDLSDYEKQYSLKIPKEYREFIAYLGDGGFGPFYGLLSLRNNDKKLQSGESADDENLNKDFLFARDKPFFFFFDAELTVLNADLLKCYEEGLAVEENEVHSSLSVREEYLYKTATRGVKFLSHEGCGMYNVLVMKGESAGTVWHLDFSGGGGWMGVVPLVAQGTKHSLSFYDWYNIWLDNAITEITSGREEAWSFIQYALLSETDKVALYCGRDVL